MKILVYSVVPSPYQRDVFRALSNFSEVELAVVYFERVPGDSPWELQELEDWEKVMPGCVIGKSRIRCHWHYSLISPDGFDAVIVNVQVTALSTQKIFRILSKSDSPPWVFWGEELISRSGWKGLVQKRLVAPLSRADAIVAIGERAKEDYSRRFIGVPVSNIPYACDLDNFSEAAKRRSPSKRCRFLFAGQMIERKGVDVLLAAFSNLIIGGIDAELHLVGREGGLPRWLESLAPHVRKRVFYLGFRQPEDLPKVFAGADVFVLPSRHDGWGVVVNQALGSGLPVITSTAAGAGRDLVKDQFTGLHVSPGSLKELLEAMKYLASDLSVRASMSTRARLKANEISPLSSAQSWIEIIRSLNLA